MSGEQKEMIMNAKSRGVDEYERWYQLWDILFPDTKRPRSPYAQPVGIEILESFRSALLQNIGAEVIREVSVLQQLPVEDCVQVVERTVSAFIRRLQQGPSSLGPLMDTSPLVTEEENRSFSEATGTITPISPIYSMPSIQPTQAPDFSGPSAASPTPWIISPNAFLWGSDFSNNIEIPGLSLPSGSLTFASEEVTAVPKRDRQAVLPWTRTSLMPLNHSGPSWPRNMLHGWTIWAMVPKDYLRLPLSSISFLALDSHNLCPDCNRSSSRRLACRMLPRIYERAQEVGQRWSLVSFAVYHGHFEAGAYYHRSHMLGLFFLPQ